MNDFFTDIITIGSALLVFVIALIGAGVSAKKGGRGAAVWALIRLIFGFGAFVITAYKVMQIIGMETVVTVAAVGIATLLSGFALQKNMENIFAALSLTGKGRFKVGDTLVVSGFRGKVTEMSPRAVVIEDAEGNINVISNSEMINYRVLSPIVAGIPDAISNDEREVLKADKEETQNRKDAADAIFEEAVLAKSQIKEALDESLKVKDDLNTTLGEMKAAAVETKETAEKDLKEARTAIENFTAEAEQKLETAKAEAEQKLETAKAEAGEIIDKANTEAAETLENAKTQATEALENAKTEAAETLETAKTEAEAIKESASTEAAEALDSAKAEAEEIRKAAETEAEEITKSASKALEEAAENAEEIAGAAEEKVEELKEAAEEVKAEAVETAKETAEEAAEFVENIAGAAEEKQKN